MTCLHLQQLGAVAAGSRSSHFALGVAAQHMPRLLRVLVDSVVCVLCWLTQNTLAAVLCVCDGVPRLLVVSEHIEVVDELCWGPQ